MGIDAVFNQSDSALGTLQSYKVIYQNEAKALETRWLVVYKKNYKYCFSPDELTTLTNKT